MNPEVSFPSAEAKRALSQGHPQCTMVISRNSQVRRCQVPKQGLVFVAVVSLE